MLRFSHSSQSYPTVERSLPGRLILDSFGCDLEWDSSGKPTILGIAGRVNDATVAYSVPWNTDTTVVLRTLMECGAELVGHNVISSDIPTIKKFLGLHHSPPHFDTLIYFYLLNPHLCKARESKVSDVDGEGEKRGGGFMNIWTMASLYTDLPNWKRCREDECAGPCPDHDVFGYNGIDALAPFIARDEMEREANVKKVAHLYPTLARATEISAQMTERGIAVDMEYLEVLEKEHLLGKEALLADLPEGVNWNSWQQILKYFGDKYGQKPKSTSEEDLREFWEETGFEEAGTLVDIKGAGRGLKAWFDRRFIQSGELHPRFAPAGATATGRWASARPNFQSIPVRRGKHIRRLIVGREGYLLYKCDYRQAEARAILSQAGYQVPYDFKPWLLNQIDLDPSDPGVLRLGGVWNAVKSFLHAGNYLEGITLLTHEQLSSESYEKLVRIGALEVHHDCTFNGSTVAFTGVNLASRMFGKAGHEERRRALDLQRRYFSKFPKVREFQKATIRSVEKEGAVRAPSGHYLQLYPTIGNWATKAVKTALATVGSNPVAYQITKALIRATDDGHMPIAQVHDELLFELPISLPRDTAIKKIREWMEFEEETMPGLTIPVEIAVGSSWGEMETIYS